MAKRHIDFNTVHTLCSSLHKQITSGVNPDVPDLIIGLSRGGLAPTALLAGEQMLNNRNVKILAVTSYSDTKQQSNIKLLFPLCEKEWEHLKKFKSILVVDDLVDSGKSMAWTLDLLKKELPDARIRTAVLFYKKSSIIVPDYYGDVATEWLVFPWEA